MRIATFARVFVLAAILGAVLAVPGDLLPGAQAEEAPEGIDAPPFGDAEVGRAAMAELKNYRQAMLAAFTALDAIVDQPPEVPIEAQEAFSSALAAPQEALAALREVIEKHGGTGGVPKPVVAWLKDQEHAWRYVGRLGGLATFYLAVSNDMIRIWEKNRLPKLREKKKVFRGLADAINDDYGAAFDRQSYRSDDKVFSSEIETYRKRAIDTAKTLQETLVTLRKHMIEEVREANPAKGVGQWSLDLSVELIGPKEPIPAEKIWITHLVRWREVLIHRKVALDAVYEKVVDASASVRGNSLFRNAKDPMKGIKSYDKIVSTLEDLFDDLIATRDDARARIKELRLKDDEDRKRYRELVHAYGPGVEREYRLRVAKADDLLKARQAKLKAARAASPARYKDLWRKMVEDVDVSFPEMERRETPQFKKEWAKIVDESITQLERDLAEIQRDVDAAQADFDAWLKEKEKADEECGRLDADQERRWEDAGLGPPGFP